MTEVYLDNAATTMVDKRVKEEMDKYYDVIYGNPSSFHSVGLKANLALDDARERAARMLKCKAKSIIFTSGGTESINLAIKGVARANKAKGRHIITTKIEHHAVIHTCEYLEEYEGFDVTYLDVDKQGIVSPKALREAIREDTILISIAYANNEIGTIQPIKALTAVAKEHKVLFHTDACQAAGYLDLDVDALGVDLLSINGSKIYGPKGVGLLYVRQGVRILPIIHGGGQEFGMRAGTENVPLIRGFVKALEISEEMKEEEVERLTELRDYFIKQLLKIPKTILNGHGEQRLPNNVNVSFLDIEGEALLLLLDNKGVFVSSGSACTSHTLDPSHVIIATGAPYEVAHGSIRFTLGRHTAKEDIDYLLSVLPDCIAKLRKMSPVDLKMEDVA